MGSATTRIRRSRRAHNTCGSAAGARLPDRWIRRVGGARPGSGLERRDLRRTAASAVTGSAGAGRPAAAGGLGRERGDPVARRGGRRAVLPVGPSLRRAPPVRSTGAVRVHVRHNPTSARSRLPTPRWDGCSRRSSNTGSSIARVRRRRRPRRVARRARRAGPRHSQSMKCDSRAAHHSRRRARANPGQ